MFPGLSITDLSIPHPASLSMASVCQCDIGRISHRCTNTGDMYQFIGTSKQHLCAEEYICRSNTTRKNILISVSGISVHGANMGPTWVLFAPAGPHVGPMSIAVREPYLCSWKICGDQAVCVKQRFFVPPIPFSPPQITWFHTRLMG